MRSTSISTPLHEVDDESKASLLMDEDPVLFSQPLLGGNAMSSDEEEKNPRDPLANPYWIENRELKNGRTDFLPGVEIQFWKDLIERYLQPLDADPEKEKKKKLELKELRNQMVFSFFMLNAIFVVVVFLLQQQKDIIFVKWPIGATANVTYIGPKVRIFVTDIVVCSLDWASQE